MVDVNQTPFNKIPNTWNYDPEIGPFIRDLLDEIDQIRRRTGGDSDAVEFTDEDITALVIAEEALRLAKSVEPIGTIKPWDTANYPIPDGWQVCDGTNGTRDMRNRFVVGAGLTFSVGDTGGGSIAATAGAPSATETVDNNLDASTVAVASGTHIHTITVSPDLPPYIALDWIQRLS